MRIVRNFCLWLILAVVLAMPVLATGTGVILQSSAETVQPGDTFTVEAALENSKAVALGTVALEYDEKAFELVGGVCLLENAMFGEVLIKEKVGTFLLLLPRNISGPVFSFTFRIKSNAAPGTYEIGAEAAFGDGKGSNVDVKGAEIKIGTQTPTIDPNEETTGPTPPVEVVSPTTGETGNPDAPARPEETTPTTEQTQPDEATLVTEQTQPILPSQSQEQPEVTTPTAPADNTGGHWWMVIPLILGCGIAVFVIQKKKKI